MEKKIIPIGYEDFKEIIDKNLYYVDKSMLVKEILDSAGKAVLLTRPRRFGKTLNLSMIRRFFEDERTAEGESIDNGDLFNGLAVSECEEKYLSHQQQYPVISLSLKSAKQPDYSMARDCLIDEIVQEFRRHQYVLKSSSIPEKEKFLRILGKEAQPAEYAKSLQYLSECLAKHHKRAAFILIDEYDVPLENAYFEGFYDEMAGFIRSLFESALKTNPYMERGIVTGCLRISRESIFTGLNNLEIHSLLSPYYCSSFGFTEHEVKTLLSYYEMPEKYRQLQDWYDGYRFGNMEIYNPWSILNYVHTVQADRNAFPKSYWSNTSSNSIVRELIEEADGETRDELETLMNGGTIEKPVHEEITYGDIHASQDNLWNFLFFTGYLKTSGQRQEGEQIYLQMEIPNREIRSIYRQSILSWFDKKMERTDRSPLVFALAEGDCQAAEAFISDQLLDTISYFDYAESYYHGFLTGLLKGSGIFTVLSNRESGAGRPDIVLHTQRIRGGKALILELKTAECVGEMEQKCEEVLRQIDQKQYAAGFEQEGYSEILCYGICFYKKECIVKKQ